MSYYQKSYNTSRGYSKPLTAFTKLFFIVWFFDNSNKTTTTKAYEWVGHVVQRPAEYGVVVAGHEEGDKQTAYSDACRERTVTFCKLVQLHS